MKKTVPLRRSLWASVANHADLALIGYAGVFFRFLYMLCTAYNVRAYDWGGHMDYVHYVLDHFQIPPAGGGWQFYQPPLYYFLSAIVGLPVKLFGLSEETLIALLQVESFVYASIAFLFALWIGKMLFPSRKERTARLLFCGTAAVFPGLVFFSSRISNDTLLLPLAFGFFACLYHWWQTRSIWAWIAACVLLSAGLLTKGNALAWIPLLPCLLILQKKPSVRRILSLTALAICIPVLLAGWLYAERFVAERQEHLVGNIGSNNGGLRIQTIDPSNFTTFRPVEILRYPFNSSWDDTYGRRYLFEHLFKSSIVGEWDFGEKFHDAARIMFTLLMVLALAALGGLTESLIHSPRKYAPVWIPAGLLIFSMMALVMKEPVGGFQDFRYVPLLFVPFFFFALRGMELLPPVVKRTGHWMLGMFIVLNCLYILGLLQG